MIMRALLLFGVSCSVVGLILFSARTVYAFAVRFARFNYNMLFGGSIEQAGGYCFFAGFVLVIFWLVWYLIHSVHERNETLRRSHVRTQESSN